MANTKSILRSLLVALTSVAVASASVAASANGTGGDAPPAPPATGQQMPQPKPGGDQTAEQFEKALGMPLEDAGGGHPGLEALGAAIKSAGEADSVDLNTVIWDAASNKVAVIVFGAIPGTFTDKASSLAQAAGYQVEWRSARMARAEALALQASIDADRSTLGEQGIDVGITAVSPAWDSVRVDLYSGTEAQATLIRERYGPGVDVNWKSAPHPYEANR